MGSPQKSQKRRTSRALSRRTTNMLNLKILEQHKKTIGMVCLAVFVGSFFVKYAVNSLRGPHQPPGPKTKRFLTPEEVKAMGFAQMAGIWEAHGHLKGYSTCYLHLELRQARGLYRGDTRFA